MQHIFKRYEKKYLITHDQAQAIESTLAQYMELDKFGTYWVQNLYFDTENWDVINTSMEKPFYKEKLRMRCYGVPEPESNVFLELKKKYDGVGYKRRVAFPLESLYGRNLADVLTEVGDNTQIARELSYYLQTTPVTEKMQLTYRRTAYADQLGLGLRITFDTDIRYRLDYLDFANPNEGHEIVPDHILMEVKTTNNFPLWLAHVFSENNIFRTSFSKYGTCFTDYQQRKLRKGVESLARAHA